MPKDEITTEEDLSAEVKGPDPKVWGHDKDRPSATGLETADVDDDGKPMEVKGPDPKVWGGKE